MLSRVADALFWMSRYLERAEHIARLIDVCFHLELDLHGLSAEPSELHWTSLTAILQQHAPALGNGSSPQAAIIHWLTFDLDNPSSIMACITRSRANARSIRGAINSEMWRELNKLYWQLSSPEFRAQVRESPHEFYQSVQCGSALFQGLCDANLNHDEGWQFIQLGKLLERVEKTLRVLDIQYQLIQVMSGAPEGLLANLRWASVLRSCLAYEAYQRLYVGRVEPEHVIEVLLLHADFPRSVRFCLEACAQALMAIEAPGRSRELSPAGRLLGLMLSDLKYCDVDQILQSDLHAFLDRLLGQSMQVSRVVQDRYSFR
jgi:uncharacterized alpha-E superfamily protein